MLLPLSFGGIYVTIVIDRHIDRRLLRRRSTGIGHVCHVAHDRDLFSFRVGRGYRDGLGTWRFGDAALVRVLDIEYCNMVSTIGCAWAIVDLLLYRTCAKARVPYTETRSFRTREMGS